MLTVLFIHGHGERLECHGYEGETIMDVAIDNGVPGVGARCGGAGHCTTCHCYVDAAWITRLTPATADEREMLRGIPGRRPGSRLTCQIKLTAAVDGITVEVPAPNQG